jgi:RNA polymerase sigma factor (TIGR02999 family)
MAADAPGDVTILLEGIRAGSSQAQSRLVALVYDELHRQAAALVQQEGQNQSLQPTDLLHQAFLRLLNADVLRKAPNRAYVYGAAAQAMRQILVEHARKRAAEKHGGKRQRIALDAVLDYFVEQKVDVLALHEALNELASFHERQSQVVTMRFFGGYSAKEVAELLNVSLGTVEGDFRIARAWLREQLASSEL